MTASKQPTSGTMFEVGKRYRIKMWEDGHDGGIITDYAAGTVAEVMLPLVKFKDSPLVRSGEIAINTASVAFVSATVAD